MSLDNLAVLDKLKYSYFYGEKHHEEFVETFRTRCKYIIQYLYSSISLFLHSTEEFKHCYFSMLSGIYEFFLTIESNYFYNVEVFLNKNFETIVYKNINYIEKSENNPEELRILKNILTNLTFCRLYVENSIQSFIILVNMTH